MQDKIFDILIIGAGAQAIAFISSLHNLFNNKYCLGTYNLKIGVVDKFENFGCGKVYNLDYPWILMNTPTGDLSVVIDSPHDFSDWVKSKENLVLCDHNRDFVPRSVFGLYLKEKFLFFKNELMKKNIYIEEINGYSLDIFSENNDEFLNIKLDSGKSVFAKYVVLATGSADSHDSYGLKGSLNYIHNPFPAYKNLCHIPKNSDVGILGSNLTAVDIAITLKKQGHNGKIIMASRNGKLPEVKGKYLRSEDPKAVLYANFEKIVKQKSKLLKLTDLLRVIRKELYSHGFYWRDYFFEKKIKPECVVQFYSRVEQARSGPTPFNIILGMIPEIAKTWRLVERDQLDLFMRHFYRGVHQKHGAIPLVNAEKILHMLEKGFLELKGHLSNVIFHENKYTLHFSDETKLSCEIVVNATGPKRNICGKNVRLPYISPCVQGAVQELSVGGIVTDVTTGKIMAKEGNYSKRLRAIGHNAEGSHPFINNFAWIFSSTFEVTESLLKEVLCEK